MPMFRRADTGLFVTLMFKDAEFVDNEVYPKLLADKLPVNLGAVYENAVAQALVAAGNELCYHTWPKEGAHRNNEIDFLVSRGKKVCPLEVNLYSPWIRLPVDIPTNAAHGRIGSREPTSGGVT